MDKDRLGPRGVEPTLASRRAHACSGVTSSLILAYLEREAGRDAVERVLRLAGLGDREAALRNESSWFDFEAKIALWAAAEEVTGDPLIARHIGEAVLEFSVGLGIKRALRAFGSPDLVFRNVVRANSKFNWAHALEVLSRERGRARLSYQDVSGVGYHRYDCEYTTGLLSTVPELFGLPAARVEHPRCGTRGEGWCEFDIHWASGLLRTKQLGALAGAVSLSLVGTGLAFDPLVSAVGLGIGAVTGGATGVRAIRFMRHRIESLETQVREQDREADIQLRSLTTLSSDLRVDEVLEQIAVSAGEAVVGSTFALLVAEPGQMRSTGRADIPAATTRCLERWAHGVRAHLESGPIVMDDLSAHPGLAAIPRHERRPFGSLCAAPLMFRGQLLGVLVALAPGATVFFAHDVRSLETFAGHAAIALWNARLVGELERQATEDPLTGLPNRRAFELACLTEIDRAAREDSPLALAALDIDHFKAINDSYGHRYGDEVLPPWRRACGGRYGATTRWRGWAARSSPCCFRPPTRSRASAWSSAPGPVSALELPRGGVSCSAGLSGARGIEASTVDLFGEADRALYRAKAMGRDRTVPAPSLRAAA